MGVNENCSDITMEKNEKHNYRKIGCCLENKGDSSQKTKGRRNEEILICDCKDKTH